MLTIRLKRVGRSGHAQFRMIIQEHRFSPKSGKVVETVGSYDPHTKKADLDKDALKKHLDNGAQPSERVVKILKAEKIDLPKWVVEPKERKKEPKKKTESEDAPAGDAPAEAAADDAPATDAKEEKPAEETKEEPADDKAEEAEPKEEKADEKEEKSEKTEAKEEPKEEEPKEKADEDKKD